VYRGTGCDNDHVRARIGLRQRDIVTGVIVFMGAMLFVAGAFHIAQSERQFALNQWEKRLRVNIADPAVKVSDWLNQGKRAIEAVAANATVEIYLSELQAAGYERSRVPQGDAQAAFVASYILSAGMRGPFMSPDRSDRQGDQTPLAQVGLALFDGRGGLVASTPGYGPPVAQIERLIANFKRGQSTPLVVTAAGQPTTIVYLAPILPLQSIGAAKPIGYAVGARPLDNVLHADLRTPLVADGGRVALLAIDKAGAMYLDGYGGGDEPFSGRELSRSSKAGEALAIGEPGRLQRAADFSGHNALLYGRKVADSALVLVASVPETGALADVVQHQRTLLGAMLLGILAIIAAAVALSRHQAGNAALGLAAAARREADMIAQREALLEAVVNAYPGVLLLVASDHTVRLANARFAGETGRGAATLTGAPIATVLPSVWRRPILGLFSLEDASAVAHAEFQDADQRWFTASVVPLALNSGEAGIALLLVDEITKQVQTRERRSRVYRGITDILLEAIDLRDPAAAAHSRRVGALARRIALALGADADDVETADLAGSLQGASKLFVTEALLQKAERLSEEDRRKIDDGARRWLELLAGISIDYPVAAVSNLAREIVYARRKQTENNELLRMAYVVAAANAYVALISPRAYRPAYSAADAINALTQAVPGLPDDVRDALNGAIILDDTIS